MTGTNFLDLPAEIRNKVYSYALEPLRDAWIGKDNYNSTHARNILFVSKQLHHEASDVLKKQSTAHVHPKAAPHCEPTTPSTLKEEFNETKNNALRNFRNVVFEHMDFGRHGTCACTLLSFPFQMGWEFSPGKRLEDLAELKSKLETFVAGSEAMEEHEKRAASVCFRDFFWSEVRGPVTGLARETVQAVEQMAACLELMRSNKHTVWAIKLSQDAVDRGDWAVVERWGSGGEAKDCGGGSGGVLRSLASRG
ncbi:uncharacterized protein BDZ99DRAFT_577623 [Mytilinidion resinicola]|uniref:F-box domain-containing protein n=1 Tax=Mytilinidion resinicola TaxID=574789 RepID=A0A6A6XYP4_9PEZI|nr:uncharacterized protein BDZ99DRAFT_577623 [Mytilinidion resinicola]KAF2801499.1 hypothetical protein BDZ99DRAFT_577623 [Mytilinidion resinicola]